MLDTPSSQYDSFIFWKMPIPAIDLCELECLGLEDIGKSPEDRPREAEDPLTQYSAFNFWREPIAAIDAFDFDLF
ncbi:PREDICTED: protein AF1q [Nanorana parkeri]|uniref:protein AF1q n=1 Tax=Nanorana parkeri TaxID=125878 RepID=UPI000854B921|nr:PREDICTED: protein AF1q [Nanorana parkeri]